MAYDGRPYLLAPMMADLAVPCLGFALGANAPAQSTITTVQIQIKIQIRIQNKIQMKIQIEMQIQTQIQI